MKKCDCPKPQLVAPAPPDVHCLICGGVVVFSASLRFITEDLGRHTAEYDQADGTLRLSWSGDQTFLEPSELLVLRNFLNTILSE